MKNKGTWLSQSAAAVLLSLSLALPAWSWKHHDDEDHFPDYNQLEYNKPLPPVAEQQTSKPGSITLKVDMQQKNDSTPLDAIPVRLGRSLIAPDDSEPPLADVLDERSISSSTALALPVVSSTTSVSK
jgi:hypothetical protein